MEKEIIEHNLQCAEALLIEGQLEEANKVLRETLTLSQYNIKVSQDILFLYIEREMYEEALKLFQIYHNEKGEELSSDFSVEDITKWCDEKNKKTAAYAHEYSKSFQKNKSLKANLFCFIREVNISDEYIEFVFKNRTDRYLWQSLKDSYITKKDTPRSPYSDTKDHVVFVFDDHTYKLRIDPVFEDLQDTQLFLKEVRKHCKLRTQKAKNNFMWVIIALLLFIALLFLKIR
ncbi:MAG: hypothetical protein SVW57_01125 [Thermodesulfobacteriota bacterium]|nr:hypothetical protein [Thermodesulfobacteriota bacterium]